MLRSLARLFSVPDKLAMVSLMRGMNAQVRLQTAGALLRSGVLEQLATSRSLEDLAAAVQICQRDILRHLLDLGVRQRLLRHRNGRYMVRSSFAQTLARDPHGAFASMLLEVTSYHQEVFQQLPQRMKGKPPQPFLDSYSELVARSSRIMTPWIQGFMSDAIGEDQGLNILELGCGAGAYLAHYAELNSNHRGIGLDFDDAVVTTAQQYLREAGIEDRFQAQHGDMRQIQTWPEQNFDVITAHQNVYYFDADQRRSIWRHCRQKLSEDGRLLLVTPTSGGPMSDYFSLILLSTQGCFNLPSVDDLSDELDEAGFVQIQRERLIPGDAVWGLAARKTPAA